MERGVDKDITVLECVKIKKIYSILIKKDYLFLNISVINYSKSKSFELTIEDLTNLIKPKLEKMKDSLTYLKDIQLNYNSLRTEKTSFTISKKTLSNDNHIVSFDICIDCEINDIEHPYIDYIEKEYLLNYSAKHLQR